MSHSLTTGRKRTIDRHAICYIYLYIYIHRYIYIYIYIYGVILQWVHVCNAYTAKCLFLLSDSLSFCPNVKQYNSALVMRYWCYVNEFIIIWLIQVIAAKNAYQFEQSCCIVRVSAVFRINSLCHFPEFALLF